MKYLPIISIVFIAWFFKLHNDYSYSIIVIYSIVMITYEFIIKQINKRVKEINSDKLK